MTVGHSGRPLSPTEQALWNRLIETVTPLHRAPMRAKPEPAIVPPAAAPAPPAKGHAKATAKHSGKPASTPAPAPAVITHNLDGHWDRKFVRGRVDPDITIDLHGHNLGTAYHRLDQALEQARQGGVRVILLITGKQRPDRPHGPDGGRGAIRAAVESWISASRHARHIAAVRGAHPRHGGAGALYIVMRR